MDRIERLYRIDQLLESCTRCFAERQKALSISRATLERDLEYMRSRFNAPIGYGGETKGYQLGKAGAGSHYELPGMWLSHTAGR